MNNEDAPLGDSFYSNPIEYIQNYVRTMNNEIFLSEFHINNFYALLAISRSSPWDSVSADPLTIKTRIDQTVDKKVNQVKLILQTLSQCYEDKTKKNMLNQIERVMSIIKATKKSIFIQKSIKAPRQILRKESGVIELEEAEAHETVAPEQLHETSLLAGFAARDTSEGERDATQDVMGLFYGLANIPNLSTMAIGNFLEYNAAERFIKFRMSSSYVLTIRNDEPYHFDRNSSLRGVNGDLYVHNIFPFLTAGELFKARGVCKEWCQSVKDAWHATFKREMLSQLLACEFCKDIEFHYKCIQLRNPFFQKLSLLVHALIEIVQWENISNNINNLSVQMKRVLLIVLRLTGEIVPFTTLNSITDQLFHQFKPKVLQIKSTLLAFLSSLAGSHLTIEELRNIKYSLLDDPFMRAEDMHSEDKTPLLLLIFVKQLTLQQILRNHIFFAQEYLLNIKKRLDCLTSRMPAQKNYLERIYKVLLLNSTAKTSTEEESSSVPHFSDMIKSLFSQTETHTADFVINTKGSCTEIFLDSATKFDIIVSTMKSLNIADIARRPEGEIEDQASTKYEQAETQALPGTRAEEKEESDVEKKE